MKIEIPRYGPVRLIIYGSVTMPEPTIMLITHKKTPQLFSNFLYPLVDELENVLPGLRMALYSSRRFSSSRVKAGTYIWF